jgi:hypothetical protein
MSDEFTPPQIAEKAMDRALQKAGVITTPVGPTPGYGATPGPSTYPPAP